MKTFLHPAWYRRPHSLRTAEAEESLDPHDDGHLHPVAMVETVKGVPWVPGSRLWPNNLGAIVESGACICGLLRPDGTEPSDVLPTQGTTKAGSRGSESAHATRVASADRQ